MSDKKIEKLADLFMKKGEDGPTEAEMDALDFVSSVQPSSESFKRPPEERLFVTRALRLDQIDYFGCMYSS